MVVNVEVPPFVDVRVIGDLRGAPAIRFQLDLVLREIEEGEVGFGLPPPVQGVLPGWVTFWRRSCCGPEFVLNHALTTFLCCAIGTTSGAPLCTAFGETPDRYPVDNPTFSGCPGVQ